MARFSPDLVVSVHAHLNHGFRDIICNNELLPLRQNFTSTVESFLMVGDIVVIGLIQQWMSFGYLLKIQRKLQLAEVCHL